MKIINAILCIFLAASNASGHVDYASTTIQVDTRDYILVIGANIDTDNPLASGTNTYAYPIEDITLSAPLPYIAYIGTGAIPASGVVVDEFLTANFTGELNSSITWVYPYMDFGDISNIYDHPVGVSTNISAEPLSGWPTEYTYQWSWNNFPLPGQTNSTYNLSGQNYEEGQWSIEISNSEITTNINFTFSLYADTDNDGLSNYVELNIHQTDPNLSDTDEDLVSDGDEVLIYNTNPLLIDSDSDGLTDGGEIYTYFTDPLLEDTDNDSIKDGVEITIHFTNPLVQDTDSDALTDDQEIEIYFTSPVNADSDNDGLSDGDEVLIHNTNPLIGDTDGDTVIDGLEVNTYGSNPLISDSDGDGFDDGYEVELFNIFHPMTSTPGLTNVLINIATNDLGLYTREQIHTLNISNVLLEVSGNEAKIIQILEQSNDLSSGTWITNQIMTNNITATNDIMFFRIRVAE